METNQNPTTTQQSDDKIYVAPSVFARSRGIKFVKGQKYDLQALGLGPHPQYGPIPEFEVTDVKQDGTFLAGTFKCLGLPDETCNEIIEVHAGDLFQKRRCETHQRKYARRKQRPGLSLEEKEQRERAREAQKLEKLAQKDRDKALRAQERNEAEKSRIEQKLADLKKKEQDLAAPATAQGQQPAA